MAEQRTAQSKDDLAMQMEQLREDVAAISNTLAGLAENKIDDLTSAAKAQSAALGERGQQALGDAADQLRLAEEQAEQYVRTRPFQSLALAAGLGLLLGYLMRGR